MQTRREGECSHTGTVIVPMTIIRSLTALLVGMDTRCLSCHPLRTSTHILKIIWKCYYGLYLTSLLICTGTVGQVAGHKTEEKAAVLSYVHRYQNSKSKKTRIMVAR